MSTPLDEQLKKSAEIARQTEEFLKKGGTIKQTSVKSVEDIKKGGGSVLEDVKSYQYSSAKKGKK